MLFYLSDVFHLYFKIREVCWILDKENTVDINNDFIKTNKLSLGGNKAGAKKSATTFASDFFAGNTRTRIDRRTSCDFVYVQ